MTPDPDLCRPGKLDVLIPAERIRRRLDELAEEISRDYAERDLVLVGLLRASFIFLADLVRRLDLPLRLDFLTAASYGDGTSPQSPVMVGGESEGAKRPERLETSSEGAKRPERSETSSEGAKRPERSETSLAVDVRGRDCLVVDAVLDTGRTLVAARRYLLALGPRSLAACVLLAKAGAREVEVTAEYVGFAVADRFLVGYGLDHAQRYRNLPYVAALRE